MSRTTRLLLVSCSLMTELASWAALLRVERPGPQLTAFVLVHALACALAAYGLGGGVRRDRWLFFALGFCIPFAGLPVLVACAALCRPVATKGPEPLDTHGAPALPYRARPHRADLLATDFDVASIVRHAGRMEQRLDAVLSAGRLPAHVGVPILEYALKDPDDEVRLLAHALLEARERELYGVLKADLEALARAPLPERAGLHARLAFRHWELVYAGLARGDGAKHLLSEALAHAEAACRVREDGELRLLMGRIHLRGADALSAHDALTQALHAGLAPHLVHPYLAEAAFLLGRRDVLAFCARQLSHGPSHTTRIAEFWQ